MSCNNCLHQFNCRKKIRPDAVSDHASQHLFEITQAQKLYQLIYIFTNNTVFEYIKKEFYQNCSRQTVCKSKMFRLY